MDKKLVITFLDYSVKERILFTSRGSREAPSQIFLHFNYKSRIRDPLNLSTHADIIKEGRPMIGLELIM